jgi:hypothetical protein
MNLDPHGPTPLSNICHLIEPPFSYVTLPLTHVIRTIFHYSILLSLIFVRICGSVLQRKFSEFLNLKMCGEEGIMPVWDGEGVEWMCVSQK